MKRLAAILLQGINYWMSMRALGKATTEDCPGKADTGLSALFQKPGRKFLNAGCGPIRKPNVPACFLADDWQEIRLDIDPSAEPDIVCSMLDMAPVPAACVDAVYSSHNIEHLYAHEVPLALAEFFRVLKPDGFLLLTCPDLQAVCRLVVEDKLTEPAYTVPIGPVAPLDILYGHRPQIAAGNLFMAHHTGFTLRTLVEAIRSVGFCSVAGRPPSPSLDLWVIATKALLPEKELRRLSETHLPHQ